MASDSAESREALELRLSDYDGPDKVIRSDEMRKIIENSPIPKVRFSSGYPELDELIKGFHGGELIAISGPTKSGKTLLCQSLTETLRAQGIWSVWFSYEVPAYQFLEQVRKETLFYMPKSLRAHSIEWVVERIAEAVIKHEVKAVFIDHLHYLVDLAKGGRNISIDIGQLVRRLKTLAVDEGIVIFLLCHSVKATSPDGKPRELGVWDLRDSSFIPQEADSTWIIQRAKGDDGSYSNRASLKICNHRRTGTMERRVTLHKDGLLFVTDQSAKLERQAEIDMRDEDDLF